MLRLTCATLVVWVAGVVSAFSQSRQIVLLYDERTDLPGMAMLDAGFVRALTAGSPDRIEIYREAMDLSRFDSREYRISLRGHLRAKYAARKIDVAVAVMEPALNFLLHNRAEIFPGTPIVFCGIDRGLLGDRSLPSDVTGVLLKREFSPTLEIALSLHPETERIVVVAGTSEFDARLLEQAREEFGSFENHAFTYLTALPLAELLSQLSRLPPKTIVLYSTMFRDGAGQPFVPHEVAERVSAAANAPVYGFVNQYVGRGIVGGRVYGMDLHGEAAAGQVLKILSGTKASELPPVEPGNTLTAFDWRQLQRWGISESRLPPGSTVLFRKATIWEQYWKAIAGIILFCLVQAALIVSLLINRARRRRGEEEATLVAEISSKFVNLPPGEVDGEIANAQRRIFEVLDLDVSGIWRWSTDTSSFFRLSHYSRAGEGPEIPDGMNSQEHFPWYEEQVRAGRTIAVRSLTELPPEAARDAETFRRFGFKSNLTIPLSVGGKPPIGAVGFNTTRAERDWPDALVKRLQLVAQIFANALARQRADQILRESEARFRTVANTAPVMIWMSGTEKEGVFFNKRWLDFTGRTMNEELGDGWLNGVHADDLAHTLEVCMTAFGERKPFTVEYRLRRKDGEYRWMLDTGTPRFESDGTFLGFIGSCIDIGERKQAELDHQLQNMELARVGRLALMGELAASLAHEVNNPLCAMVTNASAARRMLAHGQGQLGTEEFQELLGDIVSDGHRAREVIQGIHSMVRKGEATRAPVRMNDVIGDLLRIVRADAIARHVSLILEIDPQAGVVMGDRVQLLQVLLNLTMNAFEAVTDIQIEARRVIIRAERVRDEKICVSVRDSGPGFRDEIKDQLFQPFFSTKAEGTGMGLAIARSIIEAHGGTLFGENCAEGGALFTICLPEVSEATSQAA